MAQMADAGEPITVSARPVALNLPPGSAASLRAALVLGSPDSRFGGLSGVAVAQDGASLVLVSDRGTLFTATVEQRGGRIEALRDVRAHALIMPDGTTPPPDWRDAESVAVLPDGALVIGFERLHRLWRFASPGARPVPVPGPEALAALQFNSGLEALASDAEGQLYAIPERSGALDRPFPVWRGAGRQSGWTVGQWPRRPPFLVTAADIGPDGRLYVLERDASLLGGWAMRLSRASLDDWPNLRPETLLEMRGGGIDNMEGLSVRRDAGGVLRAILVSDDNFHLLQSSLLIDLALPD